MSFRTLQAIVSNQKNGTLFAVIAIVLIIVIAAAYQAFRMSAGSQTEGFADPSGTQLQPQPQTTSCPPGSTVYISQKGSMLCCKGTITNRTCSIKPLCRLSGESEAGVPHCSDIVSSEFEKLAKKYCTPELPYVYKLKSGETGCTNRVSIPGVDALPVGTSKCTFSADYATDRRLVNSCINKKLISEYECFGQNCTKNWWPAPLTGSRQYPVIPAIALNYSTNDGGLQGMNKMCLAEKTGLEMLDSHPNYKNTYRQIKVKNSSNVEGLWVNNLDKSPMICEAAKKIYIDKSLPTDQVVAPA